MKKSLIIAALLGVSAMGQGAFAAKKAPAPALKTAHDSVSYALGVNVASSIMQQFQQFPGQPVNMNLFIEALTKVAYNDTTNLLVKAENSSGVIQSYMMKQMEAEKEKAKIANDAFMAKNAQQPGVIATKSGLQYQVLKEGNGIHPGASDKVKVLYKGTLTDGTVFDERQDNPIELQLNQVIKGWTEGIQLMKIGSKFRFWIPSELGYGERAMGKIPANSVLVFDVELVDVGKAETAPQARPVPQSKYQFKPYQRR
ncbi:MAG: FKBP-type peptidyl-prolyl cis-trans isomerase [Bacteroidales bacterium]|nr:FKBP-type peptidyl-prolyl cis-trans isomerase [Candidatus Physcocola equi]